MRAENATSRARRGSTLIEVMAAMTVMLVGAVGVAGLNSMGVRLDGDGRRMTRATAIAEDLAQQIALWPYTDARLANVVTANDDDIGDVQFALERTDSLAGLVDQTEASLTPRETGTSGTGTSPSTTPGRRARCSTPTATRPPTACGSPSSCGGGTLWGGGGSSS
jgi:prepilin-type N-terminal cleavage/methylation domain-containing protein